MALPAPPPAPAAQTAAPTGTTPSAAPQTPPAPPTSVGAAQTAPPPAAPAPTTAPPPAPAPAAPQTAAPPAPAAPQTAAPPAPAAPAPTTAPAPAAPQTAAPPVAQPAPEQQALAPTAGPAGGLAQQASNSGFDGLDFDSFGVFPIVTLPNTGIFKDSDGNSLGEAFYCICMRSRPKYLYTNNLPIGNPDSKVAYSYDQIYDTKGTPIQDLIAEWASKGQSHSIKKYLEVAVKLQDNRMALLSVAPNSVGRFTQYYATMVASGRQIDQVWTLVSKGPEVTAAKTSFIPWNFSEAKG